jgi:hypothetical protein
MKIGHAFGMGGGPVRAGRARRLRPDIAGEDPLFVLIAVLAAAIVLAVVAGFVYLAGPTGLLVAAAAALPAALVAWLVDRLTRPDDAADER